MKYLALASDYDGTLAADGVVSSHTLAAIAQWRSTGRKLILITGRRLDDLLPTFPDIACCDCVVTENGAAIYDPVNQTEHALVEPPPPEFFQHVSDRINNWKLSNDDLPEEFRTIVETQNLPILAAGRVIVATWQPYDTVVQDVIREMGLPLKIILNKGAVMVLPVGVDKASGLQAALSRLNLLAAQTIGIGDAENDVVFLRGCGLSVAVANALPELKQQVDRVTTGSRGDGVVELIHEIMGADR